MSTKTHYYQPGFLFIPFGTYDESDVCKPKTKFIEMIHNAGGQLYTCKATVDMFHLTEDDFCDEAEKVLTVGQFYELSAGAEIIFT